jgi:exportin-2 (importin alpha re-exporter)
VQSGTRNEIYADYVLYHRTQTLAGLYRLFANPQHLTKSVGEDADEGLTAIDHEEQNAGYQAAYSRLAASESVAVDPVGYVNDPRELLADELGRLSGQGAFGGNLSSMVSEAKALASQPLPK